MSKSIWKQCKSKQRYRDEHMANYYRRRCEEQRGQKLDYYWCPNCNGFHLTSAVETINYYIHDDEMSVVMA